MIPILFSSDTTDFSTNGIGRLECLACRVTEERNGIYELEATVPVGGKHASDVAMDTIIGAIPYDGGSIQGFRVYEITKPLNGKFEVYARHISYQLLNIPAMPFSVDRDPTACATTLARLKQNAVEDCPFTFWTDVTTGAAYSQTIPAAIRTRLLGVEGSVLDQFGGEYEWDNWTVKLHKQRGRLALNTGITLRYGKNITDINQEENISNVITGVVPYWADTEGHIVTLTEKAVYSQYADRYPFKRTEVLDLSSKWEDAPTEEALRTAAQAFINSSELGLPKVSIEVSFVPLWQSEEYKDLLPLQRVQLCDEINVEFEKYGITRTAKIVKTVYDVLKERYDSIEVGSMRSSFSSTINDQNAQTMQAIADNVISAKKAIDNATKWLTSAGGWVIAIKNTDGTWKELVFSDNVNPYDSNAHILRINNNGIGFSTGGMDGQYRNAWTIDGNLVADFITTGTMKAERIKGGTLTLGGDNNVNGLLKILNASGVEVGKWDKDGISVSGGAISGTTIKGSTIEFGTTTENAKMFWETIVGGFGRFVIQGTQNSVVSINGGEGLVVEGAITATDKLKAGAYTAVTDVLDTNVNIGTYESGGNKYLGVYHGTTVYGSVKLS